MHNFEKGPYPVQDIDNLRDLWVGSVKNFPERPAFLVKNAKGKPYEPITYKKFGEDITSAGTALLKRGMGAGKRVAILSETRYEWYVSYLAVLSGEAVVVPLDKEQQLPELTTMLRQADVNCIIYSGRYAEKALSAAASLTELKLLVCMDEQ
ncbi:MAG: AMP-binding protein, partial [Clostridiales bacterium]|nr:AMP-binding protein [Clostridiales bacterium]